MKHILLASIAATLCTAPVFGQIERNTSSATVTATSDGKGTGKAIVTIEVNGKKETREIDLGSGNTKIEISSDDLKPMKEKAKRGEQRVVWLGVAPEELPPAVAAQLPAEASEGVLVASVLEESPAAAAGIATNDVITKVNDDVITEPLQLKKLISGHKDGDTVRVTYYRRGQKAEANAKLSSRVENETPAPKMKVLGGGGLGGLGDLKGLEKNYGIVDMLKGLGGGLTIDKEIIVVDKDGNIISRDKKDASEKIEREMARIREQLDILSKQADQAAKRAEEAARAAVEAAKKSLERQQ